MSIDLPPGISPELATHQEMHAYVEASQHNHSDSITGVVSGYEVNVYGNTQLSPDKIKKLLASSNSLDETVLSLHYAYLQAGHRLTRLRYILKDNRLSIRVIPGIISKIKGAQDLKKFFWEVEGQQFNLSDFESARILANLQSQRVGLETSATYTPVQHDSDQVLLTLNTREKKDYNPLSLSMELGNPGNRFVGRHFLFTSAVLDTNMAQWKVALTHSLNSLDDEDRDGSLKGYQIAVSSIIPIGLAGVGISQTDYDFTDSAGIHFNAEVTQAQLLLQEIYDASPNSRTLLSQRLLYVDSMRETATSQTVLDERYFAAELGLEFHQQYNLWNLAPLLKLNTSIRKGLSDNSGTLGEPLNGIDRDARFLVFLPSVSIKIQPVANWAVEIHGNSQFADRQVPEQQQWNLGGSEQLRAWLPGSLLGDGGHYLRLGLFTPELDLWERLNIQPEVFVEAGTSRFKSSNPAISGTQKAVDAGISLKMNLSESFEFSLAAAEPISDSGLSNILTRENEADFYFSLKANW